jgi:hypothetical protein
MTNWKAWLAVSVSASLAVYCIGLLYEGFFSDRYAGSLTWPFVDKVAAEQAYDRLPANAPIAERAIAANRLIIADPASPESWNAVAYTDWLAHGSLSSAGLTALDHSYAVAFFDRPSAVWRTGFALENWPELTPALRKQVLEEAKVAIKDAHLAPPLRDRLKSIQNPSGRLAAALILASGI